MPNPNHDKLGRFASGHGYSASNVSAGQRNSGSSPPTGGVGWTGPPVAKPNDEATWESQSTWQDQGFDAVKDRMRAGAQEAQRDGYTGTPPGLSGWRLQNYLRSRDGKAVQGKELLAQAVHSEPTTERYWRGMIAEPGYVASLTEGATISMPLSSFSANYGMGKAFGTPRDLGGLYQSLDVPKNGKSVVLQLEPGARVARLPLREAVAFGRFQVVSKTVSRGGTLTDVTIRQTSMIEKP